MRNKTPLTNVRCVPYKKNSSSNYWEKKEGGPIVVQEITAHWMDSLIASPNKKDVVFMHVKGPGLHYYAPTGRGGMKYVCTPQAQCKSHQCYFQKETTTALYKLFLYQYPLCRGVQCPCLNFSLES